MSWHFEILVVHCRRFVPGESYDQRSKYASIVTAQFLNGKRAYLSGMLNDGTRGPIRSSDWVEIRDKLRADFGIEVIDTERHGEDRGFDTRASPVERGGDVGASTAEGRRG